ncbi:adhesin transport system membrane fusion protein [Pseudomonas sp. JAI115]|uniref:HlyD family efflux transporter periplasmic adaptor subunit n=1 Tax=Pseudomonas sp. JAI115 TaxID=2723061 RepID=UPI0016144CD1|nr:HlyD family efflux transporter periplasmic adaptor subunit [Pseudomonas sp. JAI115]MBB6155238.1 adhesin transport system membrane fusion protein [Pseudomonas sp. JAI115]
MSNVTTSKLMTAEKLPSSSIIWLSLLVLVVFGVWSYFALLDEVTVGAGKVVPASQEQIIESLDGGIILQMLVKKGDLVKKGQVLAKLDPGYFESTVREASVRVDALQASIERLNAEITKTPLVFSARVQADPELVRQETELYNARKLGIEATVVDLRKTMDLIRAELAMTDPLISKGAASQVTSIRLRRQLSELQSKINEVTSNYYVQAHEALVKAKGEMEAQRAIMAGREEQLGRTVLTSPVDGVIKEIHVTTLGEVLKPGEKLIEIIPLGGELLIETKINPRDIAYIRPGLAANVKLTAYDSSIYGDIKGVVDIVSPDTIRDDVHPDQYFYRVYVRTSSTSIKNKAGIEFPVVPGMVASVEIKTGAKTVADYLFKPLNKFKESLRER